MGEDSRYSDIARIVKVRGLDGEVTARGAEGLPRLMYEGLTVHVVPPVLFSPRQLTVASVRELDERSCALSFEGLTSVAEVEVYEGHTLLALTSDIDADAEELYDDVIGREVVEVTLGSLGTVSEYIVTPANDVLVVNGPRGEVLIPFIEEFVTSYPDDFELPIEVELPEGLIDDDN